MKYILKILILIFPLCTYGQVFIEGYIIDGVDKNPIEYGSVAVYAIDSSLVSGAISNESGNFKINELKSGQYYMVIQFMGYDSYNSKLINLENDNHNLGTIEMYPNQKMLDEIEVTGEKVTTIHKIDRQVFEANKFQSGRGGTATDIIRNLPGIVVDAQGHITARGATGFTILINGKPIQMAPEILLNQLPANAIQNVELITAPSAKYDPEGKAGIINIITAKGATDGFFIQFNTKVGMPSIESYDNSESAKRFGGDFALNYRKDKWDISAGASYLRNDLAGRREGDVFTIIDGKRTEFPSDGERSFDEVNYSGRFTVGFNPSKNDNFSIGFFGGKRSKDRTADILYYNNNGSVNDVELYTMQYFNENLRIRRGDFALGSFDYNHKFNNSSKISTSFLYEYTLLGGPTTNLNLAYPNTSVLLQEEYNTNDNPLTGYRYQLNYTSKDTGIGVFEAGYQYRNLDHTGDFEYDRKDENGVFQLVPEFSSTVNLRRKIHSAYGQFSASTDKLDYGFGVRVEYMDRELDLKDKIGIIDTTYTYDFVKPFPSANLLYKVRDDFRIKAAYSKRVDRTTTFKMNPFPEREHSETLEQGDPELLPEFTDLVELGIIKDIRSSSVFATAYFRNVKNLVNRVNTVFNDTILNRIYSNVGIGRSLGMEAGADLELSKRWKMFLGGNVYNFSIDGTFDNRKIENSGTIYSINANTTYSFSKTMSAQFTFNYLSDRITAQGIDSRFYSPSLVIRKTFLDDNLTMTLQWLNMDLGLLDSNEQSISTFREGEFYTITNYVYEVDMILLNIGFTINKANNKSKFIKSEFGEKEF